MNKKDQLLNWLERIKGQQVVILGDIILDHYQWGEVTRISPEAPVPVVFVENETYRLGGAANVARNCRALGADPWLMGITGNDHQGKVINNMLKQEGIRAGIYKTENRKTTVKTRVMGNRQQIVRVDTEQTHDLQGTELQELSQRIAACPDTGFIVISDYGKGTINKTTLKRAGSRKLIIDPKNRNFANYESGFIMTPNKKEATEFSGMSLENREDIIRAGREIISKSRLDNLLITLGPQGMVLFRSQGDTRHLGTSARKVFDVTGAGDTVTGILGVFLEAGADLESACLLANYAAGIVVGQVGTAAADRDEIRQAIEEQDVPEIQDWGQWK